ncbi:MULTISPECIES: hypothetical protein [unclassified Sedimentibacter]|uniref:hypothetical protein n=1 Tax=unclassified Sedimentibacter TaxID=2649220 RepID=UPI0027E14604|nr:hypothetical protein [Sedimentibacter sp. MB35-C1]WMJ78469.1 hypothetical protein RBQ61_05985 [Sedimentibacter sp. MB35-C1]
MNYSEMLESYHNISEAYVVVNLYEIYIKAQKIKIKIERDLRSGKYSYSNSHHYHGSEQAAPYISSRCVMLDSESEALNAAFKELTSFYNENDEKAIWVVNECF